jgi:hypothetical protein
LSKLKKLSYKDINMKAILALLISILGIIVAPIAMIPLIFLIKWDSSPSEADGVIYGDLPAALRIFQTMDCRFPGGLYEPTVHNLLGNGSLLRRLITSYYWAGLRNRLHGVSALLGQAASDYIPDPFHPDQFNPIGPYWLQVGASWHFYRPTDGMTRNYYHLFGSTYLATGYEVYKLSNGTFWAVPQVTIHTA